MVFYQPLILKNLAEICAAMGVGPTQVREWAEMGAPIAMDGRGSRTRYSAEMAELQQWRVSQARGDDHARQ